jgi:hypothetical protein
LQSSRHRTRLSLLRSITRAFFERFFFEGAEFELQMQVGLKVNDIYHRTWRGKTNVIKYSFTAHSSLITDWIIITSGAIVLCESALID